MKTLTICNRKGEVFLVRLDDEDFEHITTRKWCIAKDKNGRCYARRTENGKHISMHRELMGHPRDDFEVDHIDTDSLNNCKENLRVCTRSQNQHNRGKLVNNTSGFKGVSWVKRNCRYKAQIKFNGLSHHIGQFEKAEDAARAYDDVARLLHGEFARTNFAQSDSYVEPWLVRLLASSGGQVLPHHATPSIDAGVMGREETTTP